jgi:hypothetical protein
MAKPKLALIPAAQGGELFSVLPSSGVGDFDFSRSGKATRINSQGLIEEVGDGVSRLNYPMIDGKVVGCPHHILEPESRNIVTYSQSLTESIYGTSNAVILDNNVISPDGALNASSITDSNGGGTNVTQIYLPNLSVDTLSQYTYSIFAKKKGLNYITLRVAQFTTPANSDCFFDLENGSIVSVAAAYDSAKIENYGNGWYRCSVTFTTGATDASGNLVIRLSQDGINTASVPQDGTSSVYLWGWSCEKQSYPTSYIKSNSGSTVTRAAETANGSGDAATFNDSEGVLMAEISALANDLTERRISLNDGSTSNVIRLGYNNNSNRILIAVYDGSNQVVLTHTLTDITNNNKFAFKYKQNDYALWVNGIEFGTSTSSFVFPNGTLTNLSFNRGDDNVNNRFYGKNKQLQYFQTALTDSELEQLTSWTSFTDMAQGQLYTIE